MERVEVVGPYRLGVDLEGRRHHGLYEVLLNPPEDNRIRQQLLNLVTEPFLWRHRDIFVSLKACFRAAGFSRDSYRHSGRIAEILRDADVPVGMVISRKRNRRQLYKYGRFFILNDDLENATNALRQSKDLLNTGFKQSPKSEPYPHAYPQTLNFLKWVIKRKLYKNVPYQIAHKQGAEERWIETRNMVGIYFSTNISLRRLGEMYGITYEAARQRIKDFLIFTRQNANANDRRRYPKDGLIVDKPSSLKSKKEISRRPEESRNKDLNRLAAQLQNPSRYVNVRQGLLNRVTRGFYGRYRYLWL